MVKLWDGVLAVPMIGTLDSGRTQLVMEALLQRIVETGSALAIIDITGVPTVDTLVAQHLLKTVTAIRLMGADAIISGIRPQIAQTIVHLGIDLRGHHHQGDAGGRAVAGDEARRLRGDQGQARRRHRLRGRGMTTRIPILRMGGTLLVTIQVDLQDQTALALQDDLADRIQDTGATGVLIDISALEIVDSFIGRMLAGISSIAKVLGAKSVVVGMQPAVAITLVELGLSLHGVRTALNVERGMALLRQADEADADLESNLAVGDGDPSDLERCRRCRSRLRPRARPVTASDAASGSLPIRSEPDIVLSRQLVRKLTQELKFSLVDQTKMITAASELSRNTLIYGGGGAMEWAFVQSGVRTGLRLAFVDQGPGIPDLELAMKDGWTSGNGMGMGLSGSKRLVNDFELESAPGRGTRVTITRWK